MAAHLKAWEYTIAAQIPLLIMEGKIQDANSTKN